MSTAIASLDTARPVIKCQSCKLTQFLTRSGNCRKCSQLLFDKFKPVIEAEIPAEVPIKIIVSLGKEIPFGPPPIRRMPSNPYRQRSVITRQQDPDYLAVIPRVLKHCRLACGLSQRELCDLTGQIRQNVSRAENGRACPDYESLKKYARAFRVNVYWLLTFLDSLVEEQHGTV